MSSRLRESSPFLYTLDSIYTQWGESVTYISPHGNPPSGRVNGPAAVCRSAPGKNPFKTLKIWRDPDEPRSPEVVFRTSAYSCRPMSKPKKISTCPIPTLSPPLRRKTASLAKFSQQAVTSDFCRSVLYMCTLPTGKIPAHL